jgi:phenylalanine-4-hydroxylase
MCFKNFGVVVAPGKIQKQYFFQYLRPQLYPRKIVVQKIQERKDNLLTSYYFQKLLGDVNWLRPHLKLTTGGLRPLLVVIKGDTN